MVPHLGPMELVIILVIALMIFGAGKLPEVGSALGRGIKEFKKSTTEEPQQLSASMAQPAPTPPPAAAPSTTPSAASVAAPASATPATGPFCPKCGTRATSDSRFCASCGASLPTVAV
ncbi:MAG TPA: twin-arginine translocase TatA/TatE family subunit [Chloroflexota bacterium]|nr:twin-arginine translocase TatA/TatE family subunit [Chloroflexota bacterium]